MQRSLASLSAVALMLCAGPAFAQLKATAQNVPEIPYDSVPNFLKLPAGEYLGESVGVATNSKGHIFVYHRSATTRLFEFDQNGNFLKEIGKGYYGFEFAHSVRVDAEDNIWTVDEGTNMVTKFSPEGKVLMVLGRRPAAVAGRGRDPDRPEPARAEVHLLPPDRCRLGPAGQHFRLRRLLQQPRGEIRPQRPLPRPGRQREGRQGAGPVQPAARAPGRRARATSTSPTAPTSATRCSTTISSPRPSTTMSGSAGRCASRRARTNICSPPTPTRTATGREAGPSPARSTRWSWTARSSAGSAMPARSSAASRSCT